ncbi:PD40 domain-containing protein [Agreia pratensis]|uniref:PD40 domain-containing protein n=1 Tax=Agreia pratensis TaxID=150121 RepID=UPI00188B32EC|nr:PD40 domain-containing protein [Agreia pratensis]MBF4633083.1 PD40 domain-containing protein [Agreia pratensis]
MTFLTLQADQRAEVRVYDLDAGEATVVFSSSSRFVEAPNWHPGGEWLVLNLEGGLVRLRADGASLVEPIEVPDALVLNNDHVISPDGASIVVTARDGHLYRLPWGGGEAIRLTPDSDPALRFKYYLHGVSPDGQTLAVIGGGLDASGAWVTNVYTLPATGGPHTQLTDDAFADDGCDFSADGETIWFNSEREGRYPGHAQLFRVGVDGTGLQRVTHDARVNWFPHPSPDGRHVLYLSYPAGTTGHPPNLDVELRLIDLTSGDERVIDSFVGGQGTTNVPGWSPDGRRVAYVAYPTT